MKKNTEQELDGQRLDPGAMRALMDLINYSDVNPDDVRSRYTEHVFRTKRNVGMIFCTSTVEEMERRTGFEECWDETESK